ncbi:hypothetical protein QUF31_19685 [Dickeya chrysanthemi]|uniref:hypothetical protein n=1 Tax=Dickeya chrysanthemi TaxID=556 RepID=UPI0025A26100|nr:hypothetical protein [Dickeya chrysanthemi]WJM85286.1 hypothetical protein QUF31_19685 [Dickeya chrysanthemi]
MSIDLQTLPATELKNLIAFVQNQPVMVQSHTKRKVVSTSLPVLAEQTTVLVGRLRLACCIFAYCY